MATATVRGPKPFAKHTVSTRFLRVPAADWHAVQRGSKTEFRKQGPASGGCGEMELPTPVVLYSSNFAAQIGGPMSRLAVLEDYWQEPLGSIGPDSWARGGFPSFAESRRYWVERPRRRFAPLSLCWAYRVRVWQSDDERELADQI